MEQKEKEVVPVAVEVEADHAIKIANTKAKKKAKETKAEVKAEVEKEIGVEADMIGISTVLVEEADLKRIGLVQSLLLKTQKIEKIIKIIMRKEEKLEKDQDQTLL